VEAATLWLCGGHKAIMLPLPQDVQNIKLLLSSGGFAPDPHVCRFHRTMGVDHGGMKGEVDPSAAGWRRRRQPESSGAAAAEKRTARRRSSRLVQMLRSFDI